MHPADIIAAIKKRGISLAELSRTRGAQPGDIVKCVKTALA